MVDPSVQASTATILGLPANVFVPFAFGAVIVLFVLLVVMTKPPAGPEFPKQTMQILRPLVSLAGGAIAGGLTGFVTVGITVRGLAIQSAGGLAILVLLLFLLRGWGK